MAQIEQAMYGKLTADAGVSALIGTRIFPGQAPQSETLPLVCYTEAAQKVVMSLTGPVNLNSYAMHFDCWGESYAEVKAVYQALRTCLSGYAGDLESGAVRVRGVFEEGGDDGAESPIHAEEDGLWRAGLDVSLWYSSN